MARHRGEGSPYLVWLDVHEADRAIAGGKGASLSRLVALGAPVPRAAVLTTRAWRSFSRSIGVTDRSDTLMGDGLSRIRGRISTAPLPSAVVDAIASAWRGFESMPGAHVTLAVRSSAIGEDSGTNSFAGLHDTVLGVRSYAGLEMAVRRCWASLWSDRAVEYRRDAGLDHAEPAIAVVIQQMVRPDVAFVLFTVDPVTTNPDHAVISASWGLGEAVVSGLVTPDHIVVDRTGRIVRYTVGSKEYMMLEDPPPGEGTRQVVVPRLMQAMHALTDDQAAGIATIGRSLAGRIGFEADIEGGIADGQVFLFQARPITTLQHGTDATWMTRTRASMPMGESGTRTS